MRLNSGEQAGRKRVCAPAAVISASVASPLWALRLSSTTIEGGGKSSTKVAWIFLTLSLIQSCCDWLSAQSRSERLSPERGGVALTAAEKPDYKTIAKRIVGRSANVKGGDPVALCGDRDR